MSLFTNNFVPLLMLNYFSIYPYICQFFLFRQVQYLNQLITLTIKAVEQFVEALCYQPEGRWIDSP